MDMLHGRIAAIDIGKKELVVCVRLPPSHPDGERRQQVRTFGTTTRDLLELRDYLTDERVATVVMESTGQYWRGAFYLLEEVMEAILVNPAHVKGLPGRKTDVLDAVWLGELAECGLVKASFVPPEPVRQLRDLTRHRSVLLSERTRSAQRLEKSLEDAQIKISSVLTDLLGASGRAMIDALIGGERDPAALANLAKGRSRARIIPELTDALDGRFGEHHAFLRRQHLRLIDELTGLLEELTRRIEDAIRPWDRQIGLLQTIPGVGRATAETIVAETGVVMRQFSTAGQLASWAGCDPRALSVGRQGELQPDRSGQPVARRRPRPCRAVGRALEAHVSRGQVPPARPADRRPARERRPPARHPHRRRLAHAHQRSALP